MVFKVSIAKFLNNCSKKIMFLNNSFKKIKEIYHENTSEFK